MKILVFIRSFIALMIKALLITTKFTKPYIIAITNKLLKIIGYIWENLLNIILATGMIVFLVERYVYDLDELEILDSKLTSLTQDAKNLRDYFHASITSPEQVQADGFKIRYQNICEMIQTNNVPSNFPNIIFWKSIYSLDSEVRELNMYINSYNSFLDRHRQSQCRGFSHETKTQNTAVAAISLENISNQGKKISQKIKDFRERGIRGWIFEMFKKF